MSRLLVIPEPLRERQARASNPKVSAWVSANAGSGKTHVLTQRVLRLLLEGAPPAQMLCLTFTKAAAANMADRVFNTLAEWTSLSDDALAKEIIDCGGPRPGPQELGFARQLFARTIETPGGLKIQTLHAFSERLLRLFPFEANVAAHFKVIDERESKLMLLEARDAALADLRASRDSAAALDLVAREFGRFQVRRAASRGARPRRNLRRPPRRAGLRRRTQPCARSSARRDGRRRRGRDDRRRHRAQAARGVGAAARGRQELPTASSPRSFARQTTTARPRLASRRCSTLSSSRAARAIRAAVRPRGCAKGFPRSMTICVASRIAFSSCANAGAPR